MINIKSDRKKQLSFDLEVSGSANLPDVRLVLMSDDHIGMVFEAEIGQNGTAKVVIPELDPVMSLLREKNLQLKLETILDNHHSTIWEENNVVIEEPVIVKTSKPVVEDKGEVGIKVMQIKEKDGDPKDKDLKFDISPDDEKTGLEDEKKKKKNKTEKAPVSLKSMFLGVDNE